MSQLYTLVRFVLVCRNGNDLDEKESGVDKEIVRERAYIFNACTIEE